ncbi:hypothetical protein DdX_14538 [Ditylenchus destructor]|uniref:Uncharacterized protein n=1 Tax=Ditylenchus destructor TaxID=166010 RepID=A0AAD4R1M7_9BILA|nr:hypothetical protein DdX_14538 [Ditylenchus destructor]
MAFNGNHQPPFNTDWSALAGCYQRAPQMSFNSPPPRPLCNVAGPMSSFHPNNCQQSSQAPNLYNGSTILNGELVEENWELKSRLGQRSLEKKQMEDQCAKLKSEVLKKDSELQDLKQSKERQILEMKHKNKKLRDYEMQKTNLRADLDASKSEVKKLQAGLDLYANLLHSQGGDCVTNNLSQPQLRHFNEQLRQENDRLKAKLEADVSRSRVHNLQTELNQLSAELQQCNLKLAKAEEKNRELKLENDRISRASQQKANANEANTKAYPKFNKIVTGVERTLDRQLNEKLQIELNNREAELRQYKEENIRLKDKNSKLNQDLEDIVNQNAKDILRLQNSDCANALGASTSMIQKLQTELDNREAKLRQYTERLEKGEEENIRLRNENSKLNLELGDFQDIVDQNAKEILRLRNLAADTERLKSVLDTCRGQFESYKAKSAADLRKVQEEKNSIVAERDRLKADLTTANETGDIFREKCYKLSLQLDIQKETCNEYIAEINQLKQDFVQSQNLKDQLQLANEKLSSKNKEFEKEAKQLWNKFFNSSNDGLGSSDEQNEDGNSGPTTPKKKKTS